MRHDGGAFAWIRNNEIRESQLQRDALVFQFFKFSDRKR